MQNDDYGTPYFSPSFLRHISTYKGKVSVSFNNPSGKEDYGVRIKRDGKVIDERHIAYIFGMSDGPDTVISLSDMSARPGDVLEIYERTKNLVYFISLSDNHFE